MKVRKAIFPAAGFGTRFLPATKSIPKEMLALVDKPIIQYGVEEALAAGCDQIVIVTGRGKSAIEDHFDVSYELECTLEKRGKTDLLAVSRQVSHMVRLSYVRQKEALGLGHAVLMARDLVGDEPFAVILPDDVIDARVPCLKQMMDVFEKTQSSIVATQVVEGPAISAYGVLSGKQVNGNSAALRRVGAGGEAEAGRCTVEERHHRTLHFDAEDFRSAGAHAFGRRWRTAAHRWHQRAAGDGEGLRIQLRGHAS